MEGGWLVLVGVSIFSNCHTRKISNAPYGIHIFSALLHSSGHGQEKPHKTRLYHFTSNLSRHSCALQGGIDQFRRIQNAGASRQSSYANGGIDLLARRYTPVQVSYCRSLLKSQRPRTFVKRDRRFIRKYLGAAFRPWTHAHTHIAFVT